jgi:hypothetical protein
MDFVRGVDVYTGAFPAARGNALSGVIELHQKEARTDRWGARITAMPTDYGVTVEGPLSEKAGMMLSVRNSLTQHYFKLFNIPILPTYQDAQFRVRIQTGDRSELILTGVGGNDKYRLFTEGRGSDALLYNIGYIPQGEQQVGAVGAVYKKYLDNGHWTYVASADGFINNADKFLGNTSAEADRTLRYRSMERAQRLRVERLWAGRTYEIKAGGGLAFRQVRVNNWNIVPTKYGTDPVWLRECVGFLQRQPSLFGRQVVRLPRHPGRRLDLRRNQRSPFAALGGLLQIGLALDPERLSGAIQPGGSVGGFGLHQNGGPAKRPQTPPKPANRPRNRIPRGVLLPVGGGSFCQAVL